MQRRQFIALLGGATTWPLAARAQQGERMRRIGVLLPASADDARFQAFVGAFLQELQSLAWSIGRNVRIDTRWATANAATIRRQATELVALTPDVILAHGASTMGPLLQATRTVPIVFPVTADPVGAGFVDSLGRPGGNATGFMAIEYPMGGKWLELLRQIAPGVIRVAVFRDASIPSGNALFGVIQAMAQALKVEVTPVNMRDADEIERVLAAFARAPGGGLIVTGSAPAYNYSDLIITLAARSHPQEREAGRSAGPGAKKVRADHQSQNRQGVGPYRAAIASRQCQRGDRVRRLNVRYWHKADIALVPTNVRFWG